MHVQLKKQASCPRFYVSSSQVLVSEMMSHNIHFGPGLSCFKAFVVFNLVTYIFSFFLSSSPSFSSSSSLGLVFSLKISVSSTASTVMSGSIWFGFCWVTKIC